MNKHRIDLFFDLHGVLANLKAVSKNYDDYLARVLLPTGIKRQKISIIHRNAFSQWLEEIKDLSKTVEDMVFDPIEFVKKYRTIDKRWENFILKYVPKSHRESVRPLLETKRVEYEALVFGAPILYPEVQSVLDKLKEITNLRMYIASSASSQHVKGAIELHNLKKYFHEAIGYDTVGAPKKAKGGAYFRNMLKLTNADPKSSIFVGDSMDEAELSLKFGMYFILVDRENRIEISKKYQLPYEVVNELNEILPLINSFVTEFL
ncbi:MAG: HAD family hydrolase [Candidatus Hodarchaeota archaeon]